MTEQVVLDVRNLGLELSLESGGVPVVSGVTFSVPAGQILGVVGESGSGKSLTALSIGRMLPRAATVVSGSIHFQGRDMLEMPDAEVAALRGAELGMVFQDPLAFLNPLMTVGQQIREVLVLHGMPKDKAEVRAVELLELVGVRDPEKRKDDYPHTFSGGMRQRVMIAIAVANNPALLLADEPTSALDVTVQEGILRLLARLRSELGMALVLITHDMSLVEEICDSVMVMYAGRVVEQGSVRDVIREPRHPYTRELMRSTPRLDRPTRERLPAIAGKPPDVTSRPDGCRFHPRCPLTMDRCRTDEPALVDRGTDTPHHAACWAAAEPLPASTPPTPGSSRTSQTGSEGTPILDVQDVYVSYQRKARLWRQPDERPVVEGVSLRAHSGRALGLVGESGCGKSTLARTIVGLLSPSSGRISIDGLQWTHASREERNRLRRTVQLVFQDPYLSLNPRQTVRQILTEPLVVHGLASRERRQSRVGDLISHVGLPVSLLDRYPYQLSGGQRQRVGIARALAVEPQLIVADEPVSALDVSVQAQIINLLADLRDELDLGYVVIAHDLSVVRHLCDEVAVMRAGKIVEHGPTSEIFSAPQHPYTLSLLAASPGSPWARPEPAIDAVDEVTE
ncbi:ABC transporter ATP-binding protein [Actinobacteria bacterium YIM 96077]|uniref:Peptide ABC transporter ATP-binding protein n=1 Tax=Phytoactinopolyspora halophila TaxID=1981511 RepID=A0A329QDT2_9ACTN|nr:ABC transporter ATP-binding protein [Phytoactinopolyspora halophila]AYY11818.1 ABC transporter ATP-binding protein [Actinobacteria bacterium YIM 96077]RAW09839.1 peptide ABC transporter ATP-binding protein [Phytoactinopolyspora halophila]